MNSILVDSDLPLKYVAYSHCFRTEAGAAGAATRYLCSLLPLKAVFECVDLGSFLIVCSYRNYWLMMVQVRNEIVYSFFFCEVAEFQWSVLNRGLYRVHQFSKVEMFIFCRPEESDKYHEELITIEENLYASLGLHFKYFLIFLWVSKS